MDKSERKWKGINNEQVTFLLIINIIAHICWFILNIYPSNLIHFHLRATTTTTTTHSINKRDGQYKMPIQYVLFSLLLMSHVSSLMPYVSFEWFAFASSLEEAKKKNQKKWENHGIWKERYRSIVCLMIFFRILLEFGVFVVAAVVVVDIV